MAPTIIVDPRTVKPNLPQDSIKLLTNSEAQDTTFTELISSLNQNISSSTTEMVTSNIADPETTKSNLLQQTIDSSLLNTAMKTVTTTENVSSHFVTEAQDPTFTELISSFNQSISSTTTEMVTSIIADPETTTPNLLQRTIDSVTNNSSVFNNAMKTVITTDNVSSHSVTEAQDTTFTELITALNQSIFSTTTEIATSNPKTTTPNPIELFTNTSPLLSNTTESIDLNTGISEIISRYNQSIFTTNKELTINTLNSTFSGTLSDSTTENPAVFTTTESVITTLHPITGISTETLTGEITQLLTNTTRHSGRHKQRNDAFIVLGVILAILLITIVSTIIYKKYKSGDLRFRSRTYYVTQYVDEVRASKCHISPVDSSCTRVQV